jgi:hypothetical protein
MFYLFKLIYIYIYIYTSLQTNISHTTSNKHKQHSIQQPIRVIVLRLQGGDTILGTKWSAGTKISTGEKTSGVSIFRSGAVNEHVLVIHPFTTRSRRRGWWHRLTRPKRRTGHVRQGEAIKDRQVGASKVALPPVGML